MQINHPVSTTPEESEVDLETIHRGEKTTRYPVGVPRPPPGWGTTTYGKLSAKHWDIVTTKSVVVSQVPEWYSAIPGGMKTVDESINLNIPWSREQHKMYNLADLVKASLMAHNHVTSREHAQSYRLHLSRFYKNAPKLYPKFAMTPKNHVSLHFGQILCEFGPSHAYKTPAFERINYALQSTNTNKKAGESLLLYASQGFPLI